MSKKYFVYAGAFARDREAKGIQAFSYDAENKQLTKIGTFGDYESMSNIVVDGNLMIACLEGEKTDSVVSFRINSDGTLEELNNLHIGCNLIAHLTIDTARKLVIASSMGSSRIVLIGYDNTGAMNVIQEVVFTDPGSMETGRSDNPRQKGSRIHSAFITPDGKHIQVCNLGSDLIYTLALNDDNKAELLPELTYTAPGGAGPRHIVYSKDGVYAYVNMEMENQIYAFRFKDDCSMDFVQKVCTLNPSKENPPQGQTSISIISSNGKWLLCGNRGQNNLVKMEVSASRFITAGGYYDCFGNMPRGIAYGPDEDVVFCCNNKSDTITVLEFDKNCGHPRACIQTVEGVTGAANVVWVEIDE